MLPAVPIVDEPALIEVLKAGKIAAAGIGCHGELNRFQQDSPLWDMDNVILTPHAAGGSQHRPRRTIEFFCDNIRRYKAGEPLKNVVRKTLGF